MGKFIVLYNLIVIMAVIFWHSASRHTLAPALLK